MGEGIILFSTLTNVPPTEGVKGKIYPILYLNLTFPLPNKITPPNRGSHQPSTY